MLKQTIKQELQEALKAKREIEVSTLRLLLAAIVNKEKEKRADVAKAEKGLKEEELVEKSQLTDEEIIPVLSSEVKQRKEAILEFEKGKREDLVRKEKEEMKVLQKYLPEQISEQEIEKLAKETIEKVGASNLKDMGKVMGALMPKLKGRAEGSLVSKIVKELLTNV